MSSEFRTVFHVDAIDEPHLLARLLGQVARKGGRIERMNSFPLSEKRMRCELTVLGCRPDFLRHQLQKVDGVERCLQQMDRLDITKIKQKKMEGQL